ncbi:putative HAT dimerization domain, ribonuclease H-like superfamily, hAT-like transposase, RNase-H [Helianthus annuus]|nr:putative HAT dimerization domain, ribonuclease H-like superfamily, hAT-like transposase, RNase-H [Helianthus annuus]
MAAGSKTNGTSPLRYHLLRVCNKSPLYKKADLKQSKLSFKPKSSGEGIGSLASHSFSQEKCKISLARMCIKDNQPFSIVDDEGFREFVWDLNPMFKFPSRWTIARVCLSVYQEEKKKLKQVLRGQTVSLTTDTWTSVQNFNYMCLTAHWVDEDWVLRKKILNFCQIANHKGETIGKLVYRCLQDWGIDRVFTVTVDNASSNDGAIKFLKRMLKGPHSVLDGKYMHLRCNAHIINLVVKDGLEEQVDSITRIRNAVRYIRSSPSRFLTFKDCVENEKIESKRKPCLDVDTRWNSTFLMLETALKFSKAFDRLQDVDINYRTYFHSEVADEETSTRKRKKSDRVLGAPDEEDWENARLFMEFLRIFFDVTKKISGSKYVTANWFFVELSKMHSSIASMCLSIDEKKRAMGLSMNTKFEKYWDNLDNINHLLYVALVLDPRNKMSYLGYSLSLIHGKGSIKIKLIKELVKETLMELFDHYKLKVAKTKERQSTSSSSRNLVDDVGYVDLEDGYKKYLEEEGEEVLDDHEVEIYLRDGTEKREETFDVLVWWKANKIKFPVLSEIAKHVLGMPISTVASESAFSTGGRVIDKYRSSLTPKTAEGLICAQDWLRSTPKDLQDLYVHGEQLEVLVDALENMEIDCIPGKKTPKDSIVEDDEDEDWDNV